MATKRLTSGVFASETDTYLLSLKPSTSTEFKAAQAQDASRTAVIQNFAILSQLTLFAEANVNAISA